MDSAADAIAAARERSEANPQPEREEEEPEHQLSFAEAEEKPEPEAEPAESEAEPVEAAPEAGDEPTIETFDDLAKALGTDTPGLARRLKIAGPGGETLTLHDLLEAHRRAPEAAQISTTLRAKEMDLARREAEVARAQETKLAELQDALERSLSVLEADAQGRDWEALRREDPIEYVRQRQDFADREGALRQAVELRNRHHAELAQRQAAERQMAIRAKADEEHMKLLSVRPEWRDVAVSKGDFERIVGMLGAYGMRLEEWNDRPDHRLVLIADAAARWWEQENKQKPLALKRVKGLPPVARPGARLPAPNPSKDAFDQAVARHRERGTVESATDAIARLRERYNQGAR